jgi:FdhD protein
MAREITLLGLLENPSVSETLPSCRWKRGSVNYAHENIASETAVALVYNGRPYVVMMATPADLEDFALGFSLSEAIVQRSGQVSRLQLRVQSDGIEANIEIADVCLRAVERTQRNLAGRTGCGLCGTQTLAQAIRRTPEVADTFRTSAEALQRAVAELAALQPLNKSTGAVHAAAWIGRDGAVSHVREDVGRHNALDKLIGALAAADVDLACGTALVTSRASYEMVQKAATVGIQVLCAMSAPTTLAIRIADGCGLTLVAFARHGRHTTYTHGHRLRAVPNCLPV